MTKNKDVIIDENRFISILLLLCLIILVVLTFILGHRILKVQEGVVGIENQIQQLISSNNQSNSPSANETETYSGETNLHFAHISGELKNPKVVIVEFSDFECPFCSQVPKLTDEIFISNPGQVMLIHFDYPLPFHKDAHGAALFANCVSQQDKITYQEIAKYLFENQNKLDLGSLTDYAKSLGSDLEVLKQCMASPESVEMIDQSMALGKSVGIKGTPAFIVSNNFKLDGDILKIDGNLVYMSQLMEYVRKMLKD